MLYQAVVSDIAKYLEGLPIGNPWKNIQSVQQLVPNLLGLVMAVAVVVFFFLLLIGGIKWITASGDKEALSSAQKTITSALIGLIIVFAAWAILNLVKGFFGLGQAPSAGPAQPGADCPSVCRETSCHGYDSFCYKNCRCICNHRGEMWYYSNPWCDADGSRQFVCRNGTRIADKKGVVSGANLNCLGD